MRDGCRKPDTMPSGMQGCFSKALTQLGMGFYLMAQPSSSRPLPHDPVQDYGIMRQRKRAIHRSLLKWLPGIIMPITPIHIACSFALPEIKRQVVYFERPKEALNHRIIPTIPLPTHAYPNAMLTRARLGRHRWYTGIPDQNDGVSPPLVGDEAAPCAMPV